MVTYVVKVPQIALLQLMQVLYRAQKMINEKCGFSAPEQPLWLLVHLSRTVSYRVE